MARIKSGSRLFAHQYGDELKKFFCEAQRKYASRDSKPTKMNDGGFFIEYSEGDWSYNDTWYGGEPYGGMTTIFHDGRVCFLLQYFGRIMPYAHLSEVMDALMEALQQANPKRPWRGPKEFMAKNGLRYENTLATCDNIRRLSGQERILSADGQETLYEATYMGGIVDKD